MGFVVAESSSQGFLPSKGWGLFRDVSSRSTAANVPCASLPSSLSIWESGTLWTTSTSWTLWVSVCRLWRKVGKGGADLVPSREGSVKATWEWPSGLQTGLAPRTGSECLPVTIGKHILCLLSSSLSLSEDYVSGKCRWMGGGAWSMAR